MQLLGWLYNTSQLCHQVGNRCSTSSMNHVHYTLRLVRCFYICEVIVVTSCTLHFKFVKNSLHWYQSPFIRITIKLGFCGNFGGCMDSWSRAKTLPLYENASALVVSKSEKGYQLMVEVSPIQSFLNNSAVQQEWSDCAICSIRFGLIDATLHLGWQLGSPLWSSLYKFWVIYDC